MTRDLRLQKYRERWKSILLKLNPNFTMDDPDEFFLEWAAPMFGEMVRVFYRLKITMPPSVTRTKSGYVRVKDRHNFISYNHAIRKQLEMHGDYSFHHEFPLPRSHAKLHALDDVVEKIFLEFREPFVRSTVIKRPKLKRKLT